MATRGWFNHYDDPDEYWDDEPLIAAPATPRQMPPPRPRDSDRIQRTNDPQAIVDAHDKSWAPHRRPDIEPQNQQPTGSRFASMELDRGFLPVRIDFHAAWHRYVEPYEAGNELLLAYQYSVATQLMIAYSRPVRPHAREVSTNAVPDRRAMLTVLLETETWADFLTISSRINADTWHEVSGHPMDDGSQPVRITADRRYIRSIFVDGRWASQISREVLGDEILRCVETIRRERPIFICNGNYQQYSDDDLEYLLNRHRLQLLNEWTR